jgi:hypothetical protein
MNQPDEITFRIEHDEEGGKTYCLSYISSIGIKHLEQVASHQINHVMDTTSHVVHFLNGGVVCFAYSHKGEILQISCKKIAARFDKQTSEVVFEIPEYYYANPPRNT